MNVFTFDGRLTRDPETELTATGIECVKFSVANDRTVKKDDKRTSFINCRAYGKTAAFVMHYFHKGDPINVCGELEVSTYDGKDGTKKLAATVYADKIWFTLSKGKTTETVSSDQFEDVNPAELPF